VMSSTHVWQVIGTARVVWRTGLVHCMATFKSRDGIFPVGADLK
jgi:hypothetical protein